VKGKDRSAEESLERIKIEKDHRPKELSTNGGPWLYQKSASEDPAGSECSERSKVLKG